MNDAKARVWKKIICFYALTMLLSFGFGAFILHAGKLEAGNLLYVTGAMWSPGLAAFATKKIFGASLLFRQSSLDHGTGDLCGRGRIIDEPGGPV